MSEFEQARPSPYSTKRTNRTIQQLKKPLLVDTPTNAVLNIHVTTTRKHDLQIGLQVVKRNAESIAALIADDQMLWRLVRDCDIRPFIKLRGFHSTERGIHD